MTDRIESVLADEAELFGLISRGLSNLEKVEIKRRTPANGNMRVKALDSNWEKFQANHVLLKNLNSEERAKLSYFTNEKYAQCQESYFDSRVDMLELIESWTPKTAASTLSLEPQRNTLTSRQLPRINLPKFSESPREWAEFRDLFTSMVRTNTELQSVKKLQYLKMSVTGEVSMLLRNIPITDDKFARAWDSLVSRYENKRKLIDTYIASLFAVSAVTKETSSALNTLLNDTKDAFGALKVLATPAESWDHMVVHIISQKLDPDSLKNWGLKIGASTDPPRFNDLQEFLLARIDALETIEVQSSSRNPRQIPKSKGLLTSGAKVHQANVDLTRENSAQERSKFSWVCSLCNAAHYISACPDYRAKTSEQRRAFLIEKNLCFNCLGSHQVKNCKSSKRCQTCAGHHHTTIHRTASHVVASPPVAATTDQPSASTSLVNLQPIIAHSCSSETQLETPSSRNLPLSLQPKYRPVLLATALVKITSSNGCQYEVRALLDQGSEVSFISESLAQRVNYPRSRVSLPINGIGGNLSTVCRGRVTLNITSRINSEFFISVNAYVLSKLTSYTPPVRMITSSWSHLKGLSLADPGFANAQSFDLVLGAEIYGAILKEGLRRGGPDSPTAQNTALGWILSGSIASNPENHQKDACGLQCSVDHELLDLVQSFWLQEETKASQKALLSKEDAQCEQHYAETHSRSLDGRYIVRLPLKNLPEELGDSRLSAQLTLLRQEKRFAGNPNLKEAYLKFLAEYEQLGHMKLISPSLSQPRRVFYLPHHAVLRESSSTTKTRVVFNGSYRTNRGISVNNLQCVGPKLQIDLADVITRWRLYEYVFFADIEKMYRQIRMHPEDWDLQRILWRGDPDQSISSYRLCTVTYGLTSAPYLALRTLRQLSSDENHRFPRAAEIIQKEIYVDDVLSGAHDISEAREKLRQINECLKAGGFVLQKWASNDEDLLSEISSENKEKSSIVSIEDESPLRMLGILWRPRSDSFLFSSPCFSDSARVTKRSVLSKIAQLFDPLGWIAPVVIGGKIFMQNLWRAGLDWDESIPESLDKKWRIYEESLKDLTQISVPRWFGPRPDGSFVEIHGFSDASQSALGAVVYLRIASDFDDIRVSLISAKTKVAPLKKLTIPRLELSAAVLLTRLISRVRDVLNLADAPTYLWTDSTVTLAYIHGDVHRWAEFVQNRVTAIKELENARWQHVPGLENPADLASRGVSPQELAIENLWWKGPAWLSNHSTSWPLTTPTIDSDVVLEVRKKHANLATTTTEIEIWDLVNCYILANVPSLGYSQYPHSPF